MHLQIESPHIEQNEKLTNLIRSRFDHLSKKYDRIGHCDVVLRKEQSDTQKYFSVEVKMEVPKKILFASDRAESFDLALDKVIHDLEHQLRRFKEELEEQR